MAAPALYFDFDGTLVDTLPGLVTATNELRLRAGLTRADEDTVRGWIGGGIDALLAAALERGDGCVQAEDRAAFLQLYLGPALDESRPYPGIEEMLDRLAAWPLVIVTNKARPSVDRLLASLDWRHRFAAVVTPDDAGVRKPDPEFIAVAARCLGTDTPRGVLFGDSEFDLLVAHASGLVAAAVTWGYRSRDELVAAAPHAWFDCPEQITAAACAQLMATL